MRKGVLEYCILCILSRKEAYASSILEELSIAEGETGRSLRSAVNTCLWERMNGLLLDFAKNKKLSEFIQECRDRLSGEWDLYII